jgi:proteasome beta subunit
MGLPLFRAHDDPGPSFFHYAETAGLTVAQNSSDTSSRHATTVIAVRYDRGVVMVGDRQATGHYIASRDVRKIEAADRYTALAISGTAARGMEFIRMAQLSFEHYEKMTDSALSLEGKANYLSPIIQRNNLSTPLLVLPLLAGWDLSHRTGRIFEYDGAGGCYVRREHATTRVPRRPRPRSGARPRRARRLRSGRQRSEYRWPRFRAKPLSNDGHHLGQRLPGVGAR